MKRILFGLVALTLILTSRVASAEQFNVLLFTKTEGFHHKSINAGVDAFEYLSKLHHFNVEWHEDPNQFNTKNLERFDVVVFLLTTGNVLDEAQQAAMEAFIRSGKGYVGIHSASDTEYEWPWYMKLVGHNFVIHPAIQTAELEVLNHDFPGLEMLPKRLLWTEEWYEFSDAHTKKLNYILSVDERSYDPSASWGDISTDGMGDFHPIAWYHEYDGGRAFYTALGHMPATYSDEVFLRHVYGGLYWAATGRGIRK